jgi:hypothetical protein
MSDNSANIQDDSLVEQLVAYLDGELGTEDNRRIEQMLATDPKVRLTLQQLDRTWHMLGELDTTPVDDRFTQSTLEMVAVAAAAEVEQTRAAKPRLHRRRWFVAVVSVVLAGISGYLLAGQLLPNPAKRLQQEWPILTNLDMYEELGGVNFLNDLQKEKMFTEETPIEPPKPIEEMNAEEKEKMQRKQDRWESLAAAQQSEIRTLHSAVADNPPLSSVMRNYNKWLQSLTYSRRETLLDLEPKERIKAIKEIQTMQAEIRANEPKPGDLDALNQWMEQYVKDKKWINENESYWIKSDAQSRLNIIRNVMLTRIDAVSWSYSQPRSGRGGRPADRGGDRGSAAQRPDGSAKGSRSGEKGAERGGASGMGARSSMPASGATSYTLTDEDLANLRSKLTAETQNNLNFLTADKQWRIFANWVRSQMPPGYQSGMGSPRGTGTGTGRTGGSGAPKPTASEKAEQLAEFFESNKITDEERDQLMTLPPEDMNKQLESWYLQRSRQVTTIDFGPYDFYSGRGQGRGNQPNRTGEKGPPRSDSNSQFPYGPNGPGPGPGPGMMPGGGGPGSSMMPGGGGPGSSMMPGGGGPGPGFSGPGSPDPMGSGFSPPGYPSPSSKGPPSQSPGAGDPPPPGSIPQDKS